MVGSKEKSTICVLRFCDFTSTPGPARELCSLKHHDHPLVGKMGLNHHLMGPFEQTANERVCGLNNINLKMVRITVNIIILHYIFHQRHLNSIHMVKGFNILFKDKITLY